MPEFVLLPDSSGQPVSRQEDDGVSLRYISQDGTVTWLPEDWSPSPETPAIPPALLAAETKVPSPPAHWYGWLWVVVRQFFALYVTFHVAMPLLAMGPIFVAWWTASDDVGGSRGPSWFSIMVLLADAVWLWYELKRQARIKKLMDEQEPGYAPPAPDPRELGPATVPAIWVLGGIVAVVGLQGLIGHGYPERTLWEVLFQAQGLVALAGLIYGAYLRRAQQSPGADSGR